MRAGPGQASRYALAAAAAALFFLLGEPLIGLIGLHYDEAFHAIAALSRADPARVPRLAEAWPLMVGDSHNGALHALLFRPLLFLFAPSVRLLRTFHLALGAGAVFLLVLFVAQAYGAPAGLVFAAWIAADPGLLIQSCFDKGPVMLSMLLEAAGLCLLMRCWEGRGDRRSAAAGGMMFGMALWDKASFLWLLAAGLISAFVWGGEEPGWREIRARRIGLAGGIAAGASPLICFNVLHPLATFRDSAWGAFNGYASVLAERWLRLRNVVGAGGTWENVSAVDPPRWLVAAPLFLCLLGGIVVCFGPMPQRRRALRAAAAWWTAAGLAFAACCLSPLNVMEHHLYVLLPLPLFAASALLAGGWSGWPKRAALAAATVAAVVLLTIQFAARRELREDLSRFGGSANYYLGMRDVGRWLEAQTRREPGLRVYDDSRFRSVLPFYTEGRVSTRLFSDLERDERPGSEVLLLSKPPLADYGTVLPNLPGLTMRADKEFRYRGAPWVVVWRGRWAISGPSRGASTR